MTGLGIFLGFETGEKERFYNYLLSIGLRENGANEIIERLENNRPDREDITLFERWQQEQKTNN